MTYLALTAAVSMSMSDPQFDLPQDYSLGVPIVESAQPAPTDTYYDATPRNQSLSLRRRQQALQNQAWPWQPEEPIQDDQEYYDDGPIPDNGEYWTFDGSGTIPLRYGLQTDDGRYEYDLSRDEITFRMPGGN